MWSPTHVQVTVCRVRGLLTKGKNGTNDAFVTISLGKEKFQTSVKQKSPSDLEWQEECELAIPTQGNTAEIVLTALHQNFIGVDEFLGMAILPLSSFDVYERPRLRWYPLKSKPGHEGKSKNRGEIEIRVAFTVKSGSLLDLSQSKKEKHKGSFGHLSQAAHSIGGSLLSLGSKERKGIKKLASSVGSKLRLPKSGSREDKEGRLSRHSSGRFSDKFSSGEPDPGVISEDEDEFRFDELSHKSSGSSLNLAGSQASGSLENLGGGELLRRNSMTRGGMPPSRASNSLLSSLNSTGSSTALQSSASNSNKSPAPSAPSQDSDANNDWNKKLFGKQTKVMPVKEEESPTSSLLSGGVPSIIIQDSFIAEEGAAPSAASPVAKSSKIKKTDKIKASGDVAEPPVELAVEPPKPRQRKDVVATPKAAGEEDIVLSTRMSESLLPSFPVDAEDDDHVKDVVASREPPVPKPRSQRYVGTESVVVEEMPQPFETTSIVNLSHHPGDWMLTDVGDVKDQTLDEDGVCQLLEEAVEDHDYPPAAEPEHSDDNEESIFTETQDSSLPEEAVNSQLIHSYQQKKDQKDEQKPKVFELHYDYAEGNEEPDEHLRVLELYNEETEEEFQESSTDNVDLFNEQTVQISPVERPSSAVLGEGYGTPVMSSYRRDRLLSLFSTPHSEKNDAEPITRGHPVQLDWIEPVSNCSSSQGFGGSDHLSSASTVSPGGPSSCSQQQQLQPSRTTVGDSAVAGDETAESSESRDKFDTSPPLTKNTPSRFSVVSSSSKADLSWDSYDIRYIPTPDNGHHNNQSKAEVMESTRKEESAALADDNPKKKRISLAPCLRTLSLDYPTADSPISDDLGSPIKELGNSLSDSAEILWHFPHGETHRMKMAASFHQRVVVGEEMAQMKDYHMRDVPSSISSPRNGQQYQGRSREALITLLEDRDNEIADLKDYIDCLLLRVIDTCPTVLQTPLKKQASRK